MKFTFIFFLFAFVSIFSFCNNPTESNTDGASTFFNKTQGKWLCDSSIQIVSIASNSIIVNDTLTLPPDGDYAMFDIVNDSIAAYILQSDCYIAASFASWEIEEGILSGKTAIFDTTSENGTFTYSCKIDFEGNAFIYNEKIVEVMGDSTHSEQYRTYFHSWVESYLPSSFGPECSN